MDDHGERKPGGGFWFTGKHLAIAAAGVGTMSIPQLMNWKELLTGEQARRQDRIELTLQAIDTKITKLSDDTVASVRRVYDKNQDAIAQTERRCEDRMKEMKVDVTNLQLFAYKTRPGHGS